MPGTAIRAVEVAVGTAMDLPVPVPAGGVVSVPAGGAVFAGIGVSPGGRASAVPVPEGGVAGGGALVGVGVVGATVWATGGAMPVTAGPPVCAGGAAGVAGVACAGCVVRVRLGPETREPPLTGSTGPPVVTTQPTANIEPTAAAANHLNWVSFISSFS